MSHLPYRLACDRQPGLVLQDDGIDTVPENSTRFSKLIRP